MEEKNDGIGIISSDGTGSNDVIKDVTVITNSGIEANELKSGNDGTKHGTDAKTDDKTDDEQKQQHQQQKSRHQLKLEAISNDAAIMAQSKQSQLEATNSKEENNANTSNNTNTNANQNQTTQQSSNNRDKMTEKEAILDDLMKYMDNPLRSPLCRFVQTLIYHIGDVSFNVPESQSMIRNAMSIVLKEYIKILDMKASDIPYPHLYVNNTHNDHYFAHGSGTNAHDSNLDHNIHHDAFSIYDDSGKNLIGFSDNANDNNNDNTTNFNNLLNNATNANNSDEISDIVFQYQYKVLPIIWGILSAIKDDSAFDMDKHCAKSINKSLISLVEYSKSTSLWRPEWEILVTGVRGSLLSHFIQKPGIIDKVNVKIYSSQQLKDFFKESMEVIFKKSSSSVELREQHMRLATLCAIYERSLRKRLESKIKTLLTQQITKYSKSYSSARINKFCLLLSSVFVNVDQSHSIFFCFVLAVQGCFMCCFREQSKNETKTKPISK